LDWSSLGGVAKVREYQPRDYEQVRTFKCVTPGQKYTKDPQRVIRNAPDEIAADSDARIWIAVADHPDAGIVGVIVYQEQPVGLEEDQEFRPFITALGVHREYRRQGIGTMLKTAAMLDMADRGISGPTVSLVNRRNTAMLALNQTRFNAIAERDPDDSNDAVVTAAIEPAD
jgi:ribosomal protein S18 acetylase RimI-like enzyme